MILNAPEARSGAPLTRVVNVQTGGAPPSPTLLATANELRMNVTHLYGLTETFGPIAINEWHPEWDCLPSSEQAALRARQGVANVVSEPLRVVGSTGSDVPPDGSTVGEIVCRGNTVMLGYFRDEEATSAATFDESLRTGDLAVVHPDGYVEIQDRAKDIVISGGENIASVEVERVLDTHPAVLESAVVAATDPIWGEVPVAFVTQRDRMNVTEEDLIEHVRAQIAHFKAPRRVLFGPLPKTSTGKVQKGVLRARLKPVSSADETAPPTRTEQQ
jgi:fatty-acyl-CoA synthase